MTEAERIIYVDTEIGVSGTEYGLNGKEECPCKTVEQAKELQKQYDWPCTIKIAD